MLTYVLKDGSQTSSGVFSILVQYCGPSFQLGIFKGGSLEEPICILKNRHIKAFCIDLLNCSVIKNNYDWCDLKIAYNLVLGTR